MRPLRGSVSLGFSVCPFVSLLAGSAGHSGVPGPARIDWASCDIFPFPSHPAYESNMNRLVLAAMTIVVLIAFAANSVLGRMALKPAAGELIDPATYTTIRVTCGAIVLFLVRLVRQPRTETRGEPTLLETSRWFVRSRAQAPFMLTMYAVAFSFAYVKLDAATGTLILFAFVQLTMVSLAAMRGERPRVAEILGLSVASGGLVFLMSGSGSTFAVSQESLMMAAAGIGWGAYSMLGRGSTDPISDTARNFAKSVPLVVGVSVLVLLGSSPRLTQRGFLLAAASGGLTSGLGYVLWYSVLPQLRTAQAAAVQLSTPIVAAIGGFIFANDDISLRTCLAGAIILSGIAMTIRWRKPTDTSQHDGRTQ